MEHIDVLAGVQLSNRVVVRQSAVVVASVSDLDLLRLPSSDLLIEVSPALVNPNGLMELTVDNEIFEATAAFSFNSYVVNSHSLGI